MIGDTKGQEAKASAKGFVLTSADDGIFTAGKIFTNIDSKNAVLVNEPT